MNKKELSTKWWYRLLQVTYGVICLVVLGTLALVAYAGKPQIEIDYDKSAIACETSGDVYRLRGHFYFENRNALSESSDVDAKGLCIKSYQTTDEYRTPRQIPTGSGGFFSNIDEGFENSLAEMQRLEAAGHGNYRLEIVKTLSQPWSSFLKGWGIAFSIALLILFAIRQATLYILAGRN